MVYNIFVAEGRNSEAKNERRKTKMLIAHDIGLKGGEAVRAPHPKSSYLFSPCYSYSRPSKFRSWKEGPGKIYNEQYYDISELVSSDFSVWCDERQEYVPIAEGVVVKNGEKYIWFAPSDVLESDSFREVHGEFELTFHYSDLKLKVKA